MGVNIGMVVKIHVSNEKIFDAYVSQLFGVSGYELLERFGISRAKLGNKRYAAMLEILIKFLSEFNNYKLDQEISVLYRAVYLLTKDFSIKTVQELVDNLSAVMYWKSWDKVVREIKSHPPLVLTNDLISKLKLSGFDEVSGVGVFRYVNP
jgi:hypothetical protein